jgi:hypothetical protein
MPLVLDGLPAPFAIAADGDSVLRWLRDERLNSELP